MAKFLFAVLQIAGLLMLGFGVGSYAFLSWKTETLRTAIADNQTTSDGASSGDVSQKKSTQAENAGSASTEQTSTDQAGTTKRRDFRAELSQYENFSQRYSTLLLVVSVVGFLLVVVGLVLNRIIRKRDENASLRQNAKD